PLRAGPGGSFLSGAPRPRYADGMNTTRNCLPFFAATLLFCGPACDSTDAPRDKPSAAPEAATPADPPPPAPPAPAGKRVPLNPDKPLFFETLPDGKRRVLVQSEVCLREGMLEVFLCREMTKEHESILHANLDARALHAALEAAGAKPGSTVQYQPD